MDPISPTPRRTSPRIVLRALMLLGVFVIGMGAEQDVPSSIAPGPGDTCIVCGQSVGSDDLALVYRGRRVTLHRGACLGAWRERREAIFASRQPRGALFQEPAEQPSPLL